MINEIKINTPEVEIQKIFDKIDTFCTSTGISFSIEYISDFSSSKIIRDIFSFISNKFHLESSWEARLILIIDELNNNAIEHGSQKNDYNYIHFLFNFLDEENLELTISVDDSGKGPHPKSAEEMYNLRDQKIESGFGNHFSIRGRGLFLIIQKLADNLAFEDNDKGGLRVIVSKKLTKGNGLA